MRSASAGNLPNVTLEHRNTWVDVKWMPHASLSQTSHIYLSIRSVLSQLDEPFKPEEEWQVRATVHGIAGISIVPVATATSKAPLLSIRNFLDSNDRSTFDKDTEWLPLVSTATHICNFDSILNVPIRWRDLPRDAYLLFEVLRHCDEVLYQTTLPMFDAYGKLQTGLLRLDLTLPSDVDTSKNAGLLPPPKKTNRSEWKEQDKVWKASRILDRLERFESNRGASTASRGGGKTFGEIPSVPWLDAMAKDYCEKTLSEARETVDHHPIYDEENKASYLIVELPVYEVPVMHEETFYPVSQDGPSGSVTPLDLALYQQKISNYGAAPAPFHPLESIHFLDYENEDDNPVEDKYRTLAHDLLRGLVDPALKPDRVQRDKLAAIIASPSYHPTREEKDLLWRFRFSLVDNRRALAKFLLAVDWTVESEVVQAAELLEQWRRRAPIMVTDALKLLGKQVAYQTNLVRAYAIDTLATAPDEELSLYLLQLVQALKFENIQETGANQVSSPSDPVSSLGTFLIGRAAKNIQLANYLYWYLKVELQDPTHGARYREVFSELQRALSQTSLSGSKSVDPNAETPMTSSPESAKEKIPKPFKNIVDSVSKKIGSSLRGVESTTTSPDTSPKKVKKNVWDMLSAQDTFISGIMEAQMSCGSKGKKDAKEAHIRSVLEREGFDKTSSRDPFPLPCAPNVLVSGINPQTAKIFKSAVYPALIEFYVDSVADKADFGLKVNRNASNPTNRPQTHNSSKRVIVKTGDDLRQDQLAMMMIKLMDGLLKRASLDLCLTAYSIIATSPSSGIVEFVEGAMPVSAILANHNNSILQFFQSSAPQKGSKYDVRPDVISSYVRSCAGYCVLTYLLGVGDRHLDNMMITTSGHFFHIDFGFMFGRDPKPLPPLFRLTREMVEGMGGLESPEYRQFCSLACQAFNALRKSAGLVLNLLHLMSDAGIEDLSNNPSADADGIIAMIEDKFRLDLTDEQAERFFLTLISDSLAAIAPKIMDVFHSIAVARR